VVRATPLLHRSYTFAYKNKNFTIEDFNVELLRHEALFESRHSTVVFNTTLAFAINKKPSSGQKKRPFVLVIARPSYPSQIDGPINCPNG